MRVRWRCVVFLSCLATTLPTGIAVAADDVVEQAKQYFDAGRQAYEAGHYAISIAAFEAAYDRSSRPAILFSLAQAYRRQYFADLQPKNLRRAVELYQRYLREVEQGGRRDDAVQLLSDLMPLLARVDAEQPGKDTPETARVAPVTRFMITSKVNSARASLDASPPAEVPLLREVTPGKHKLRVEAPGYFPEDREEIAVDGSLVVVDVPLREIPAHVTVNAPEGAKILVDGHQVGVAPIAPLELSAGKHAVLVMALGHYAFQRELVVEAGGQAAIDAELEPTTQRKIARTLFQGATVLFLGGWTAAFFAFDAQSAAVGILDKRDKEGITDSELDEYERLRTRRDGLATGTAFLFGGALILGGAGALSYFLDAPHVEGPQSGVEVSPGPSGSNGISLGLSF